MESVVLVFVSKWNGFGCKEQNTWLLAVYTRVLFFPMRKHSGGGTAAAQQCCRSPCAFCPSLLCCPRDPGYRDHRKKGQGHRALSQGSLYLVRKSFPAAFSQLALRGQNRLPVHGCTHFCEGGGTVPAGPGAGSGLGLGLGQGRGGAGPGAGAGLGLGLGQVLGQGLGPTSPVGSALPSSATKNWEPVHRF